MDLNEAVSRARLAAAQEDAHARAAAAVKEAALESVRAQIVQIEQQTHRWLRQNQRPRVGLARVDVRMVVTPPSLSYVPDLVPVMQGWLFAPFFLSNEGEMFQYQPVDWGFHPLPAGWEDQLTRRAASEGVERLLPHTEWNSGPSAYKRPALTRLYPSAERGSFEWPTPGLVYPNGDGVASMGTTPLLDLVATSLID